MGIDQPEVDGAPDARQEAADGVVLADRAADVVRDARERATHYGEYQAAVEDEYRVAAESRSGASRDSWDADVPELRRAWAEHETRWPLPRRSEAPPPPDNRAPDNPDAPGAWRGDGGRRLTPEANAEVDRGCQRIREVGENLIVPCLRGIEAEDPDRRLIGFEYRFKGPDRIKEKVASELRAFGGITPTQVLSSVPDPIRFTFCYSEAGYADGTHADVDRLKSQGFEQIKLKNSWTSEQYRGINSQWRHPESGVRFEVQFHTHVSFEAKQLTHGAYERLRNPQTTRLEHRELEEFQRQACARIAVPRGAVEIEDYPPEKCDG